MSTTTDLRYVVAATTQHPDIDNGAPTRVVWYEGTSLALAVSALSDAAVQEERKRLEGAADYLVWSVRMDTHRSDF